LLAKALDPDRYANRRAEMWDRKRQWYDDPAGVQVPDDDLFQRDECSIAVGKGATKFDSSGRLLLESKDHIRDTWKSRGAKRLRKFKAQRDRSSKKTVSGLDAKHDAVGMRLQFMQAVR
jgi:hypothetical protein